MHENRTKYPKKKTQMYQQLSELNSDQLTQTVSIYDKHVDDYSTADNELINNKGQIHIGI